MIKWGNPGKSLQHLATASLKRPPLSLGCCGLLPQNTTFPSHPTCLGVRKEIKDEERREKPLRSL